VARVFWAALGAAAGVYAVRKVGKAAQAYTPAGVASGLSDFGDGLRELAAAVREGMAEREGELRLALGIDAGTTEPGGRTSETRLDATSAQALLDDPTGPRAR
jgi:Family of unknown function (DUF6167)